MSKDLVDIIVGNKDYDKGNKLIKLYSVVMLNYRQPLGDKAWKEIGKLFNDDSLTTSFSFLMGFASGGGADSEKFKKFISSDLTEIERTNHGNSR